MKKCFAAADEFMKRNFPERGIKYFYAEHGAVLQFWEQNRKVFPVIYKVLLLVLGAQASNCSSERLFSRASGWDTPKRNRKRPEALEKDVLLSYNYEQGRILRA